MRPVRRRNRQHRRCEQRNDGCRGGLRAEAARWRPREPLGDGVRTRRRTTPARAHPRSGRRTRTADGRIVRGGPWPGSDPPSDRCADEIRGVVAPAGTGLAMWLMYPENRGVTADAEENGGRGRRTPVAEPRPSAERWDDPGQHRARDPRGRRRNARAACCSTQGATRWLTLLCTRRHANFAPRSPVGD